MFSIDLKHDHKDALDKRLFNFEQLATFVLHTDARLRPPSRESEAGRDWKARKCCTSKHRAVRLPPGEIAKRQARNGAHSLYREIDTQEMGDRIGQIAWGRCVKRDLSSRFIGAALLTQPPLDVLVASHHRHMQERPSYAVPAVDSCFIGQQQLPGIYYDRSR